MTIRDRPHRTASDPRGRLLPPVAQLRDASIAVAHAVARQAQIDGVVDPCDASALTDRIHAYVWEPSYRPYERR